VRTGFGLLCHPSTSNSSSIRASTCEKQ
jgi:hypothetical protein